MRREENETLSMILGQLARSGAPLGAGLRAAAEEVPRGALQRTLLVLADSIDSGQPLDEALLETDSSNNWVRGFVVAGLRSGALGQVLSGVVDQQRRVRQTWSELRAAMVYPISIVAIAFAATLLIGSRVAVDARIVVEEFNFNAPVSTLLFIETMRYAPVVAAILLPGLVLAVVLLRMLGGARSWHRCLAAIPIFGPMRKWAAASQLTRLTAILLKMNVPLDESLRLVSGGMQDAAGADSCRQLAEETARGLSLTSAIDRNRFLPPMLQSFVRSGEDHNNLAESLEVASMVFDGMIQIRTSAVRLVVPPVAFVLVGILVMYVQASILMPMVTLMSAFS